MSTSDDYLTVVDGKKSYSCDLCKYSTPQKSHMTVHLNGKKHLSMIENPTPKQTLKGKTLLLAHCKDAMKIDTTIADQNHWSRNIIITEEDYTRWGSHTPHDFIMYYFPRFVKSIGLEKFPYRCVDVARKRFYYNDVTEGWTDDLGSIQLVKFIKNLFCSLNLYGINMYHKGLASMCLDTLNKTCLEYSFWSYARESDEDMLKKSVKRATGEKGEVLETLASILQIHED